LKVAENNQPAQSLYKTLDYREAGRRKGHYKLQEGPVDTLMLKAILIAGAPRG